MPKSAPTLFHPKKKGRTTTSTNGGATGSPRVLVPSQTPSVASTSKSSQGNDSDDDNTIELPTGPYSEFKLLSCPRNGWKYDVMKFDSRNKVIDISTWKQPIKLNRKELRRAEDKVEQVGVKAMLGADGKPVIDQFGNPVMVDKDGLPVHTNADGSVKSKEKKEETQKKGFKGKHKKVRQVFLTDEATRQMRKEERYPWVMEDAVGSEVWTASMEETSKADVYAFFMPAANNVFNFVPAHRWYKFHKKPSYYVPTLEEAEQVLDRIKKNKDPQTWLLRNKGNNVSEATLATLKAEDSTPGPSLGPGGRRLRAVDSGMNDLFGDDDEDSKDAMRRKAREMGGEGDLDEVEYEEDFADDEENMEIDEKIDEEAKELEERMKREYRNANKQRDEGIVDDSDEEDDSKLSKEGKRMKKLIQNIEKNDAYDSDQEGNPYASSGEEEEEEELPTAPVDPATKPGAVQPQVKQEPGAQPQPSTPRAGSPVSPSLGGHSMIAKRATSPKLQSKSKTNGIPRPGSRATSPLAEGGSRAVSPTPNKPGQKRKAEEGAASPTSANNAKKRKAAPGELTEELFVQWLTNAPGATTKDCIKFFTPYLVDEATRAKLKKLVTSIAILNDKVLVLRKNYRPKGEEGAASPKSPSA